jgi:hypothetical protein
MKLLKFFLLISFTLHAALPTVSVINEHGGQINLKYMSKEERLLSFSIDNPELSKFSLKIDFKNKCSLKRLDGKTAFPFTAIKLRLGDAQGAKTIDIWEKNKNPNTCDESFIVHFTTNIKSLYNMELLGSWGEGGCKLAAGTYRESVILTIIAPPQP